MQHWKTEVRHDRGVFDELAEWWDAQPIAQQVPFLNSRILNCWQDGCDEPGSRRHVLLLRRDGELVAGLPLYRSRGRLRSQSSAQSDSIDVVTVPDEEVVDHLAEWLDTMTIVQLLHIREASALLRGAPQHPRWSVSKVKKGPYVDLTDGMDQVRAGWRKDFARTLRRRRRRLEEMGPVTYVDHPAPHDIESVLNEGLALEAAGWKGEAGVAVLNQPTVEKWYRSVAEVAQENGWLRLSSLYLDERMVAFRYDLQYGDKRYGQISSYDPSPDVSFSTGSLVLEESLERAAMDGLSAYEFGKGAHPWKYDWTSRERNLYDLFILGSGLGGRFLSTMRAVRAGRGASMGGDEGSSEQQIPADDQGS